MSMISWIANGTGSVKGWLDLWNEKKMAVVPGVARYDHGRSHFKVKDSAAKGVSVNKEAYTKHGWLAKAIYAYEIPFFVLVTTRARLTSSSCTVAHHLHPPCITLSLCCVWCDICVLASSRSSGDSKQSVQDRVELPYF